MAVNGTASQIDVRQSPLGAERDFEASLRALLAGWTAEDEVLRRTPGRVLKALEEMTGGYDEEPAEILSQRFPVSHDDLVILKDVEFVSLCEHHLIPFTGRCHLAYLPQDHVVGLSKLARLVDCFARRLQIQERLSFEIAHALLTYVSSRGSAVVVEATHGCMACRGVRKSRATFITSSLLGAFREDRALRQEFFAALQVTGSLI